MRKLPCLSLYAIIVLVVSQLPVFSQTKVDLIQSQAVERKAVADYRAGNFPGFLENMAEAGKLRPNHPRLLYNLADAYALNKKPEEAFKLLLRLANMGLYFQPEKDDDFKSW